MQIRTAEWEWKPHASLRGSQGCAANQSLPKESHPWVIEADNCFSQGQAGSVTLD